MSNAALSIFQCEPRQELLTKARCAENYFLANGGAVSKEDRARLIERAGLPECKKCPIGAKHREEAAGTFVEDGRLVGDSAQIGLTLAGGLVAAAAAIPDRSKPKPKRIKPSSLPAPLAAAAQEASSIDKKTTAAEFRRIYPKQEPPMDKIPCLNPDCGKLFTPKRRDSTCCSKPCQQRVNYLKNKNGGKLPKIANGTGGATPPEPAKRRPPANGHGSSASDLIEYIELLHQVEAFEEAHPDVVDGAKALLERLNERG